MERRDFLGALVGLASGTAFRLRPGRLPAALDGVGLQLYTLRHLLEQEFERTLAQVAEMGYEEVEFAGYYGHAPGVAGRIARELGLNPVSGHVPLEEILDAPGALLDACQAAAHRHVCLAWIEPVARRTLDDWRRLAEVMNRFGEQCAERGLTFAYHNQSYEFEPVEGRVPYDLLVESTDRRLVRLQLDLFWLKAGGRDPLAALERYGERVLSCHVKDMNAEGGMVDVGAGVMAFGPMLSLARDNGVTHFFVEHDEPEDPLKSARRGLRHLQSLEGG